MKMLAPWLCLLCAAGLAGCAKSPTSPSGGVTVAVAAPLAPANGARIPYDAQPIVLSVGKAATTAPDRPAVYTFEVGADASFGTMVVVRDVAETGEQTSLTLDTLPADRQYFWRVRATVDDTAGVFSSPVGFTIGPEIVIEAPSPSLPTSGAIVSTTRPTLTVQNADRTGPVGAMVYRFEIARDGAFANLAASGVVAEGSMQTSFTPSSDLAYTTTYYWRANATDTAHDIDSPFSATETFRTPLVDPKTYLGAAGQ